MGLILLRYGELALKGRNRRDFVRRLRSNVRSCLRSNGIGGSVDSVGQRVYVKTDQVQDAVGPLSRVFGLVSLSAVVEVERDLEAIIAECVRQAREAGIGPGVSFRVRARRADKTYPHTSPDIDTRVGKAIQLAMGGDVDLSSAAEVTIQVEVTGERTVVFCDSVSAPGGLPVGVSGRVVALLSGGIDSPVAAWMMMKRGCSVIPLHFSQSDVETAKAMDNVEILARYSYGWDLRPIVLDHGETIGPTLERLRQLGQERWSCVFCKRALVQRACELAAEHNAHAVVMGDSLGQVASQTLPNLEVISHGMAKPILRPLIGLDKTEIMGIARRIGTFDTSTRDSQGCPFLPAHPMTRGTIAGLSDVLERVGMLSKEDA